MLKNKKGFTIIELIVVMAVIAILVTMGVPRFLGYTKDAEVTGMKADVKILETAALQFAIQNDDALPSTAVVVTAPAGAPVGTEGGFELDAVAFAPFVRSTQNPLSEYYITDDFVVLHREGVDDSGGNVWFGIDVQTPAP